MERDRILERLKRLLIERTGVREELVQPAAKLFDDLGLDSLDLFELAAAIEDEFNLKISDSEMKRLTTVEEAAKLVIPWALQERWPRSPP